MMDAMRRLRLPVRAELLMRLALLSAVALWVVGCTHVHPWERGKLAHPTMSGAALPGGPAEAHAYSVQEGAVGGGGAAESGCGCN